MKKIVKDSERWYPCICDSCGWVGSSADCGTDCGDSGDSDVYCPRCGSVDTDEYGCNHYPPFQWLTDLISRYKAWRINRDRARYYHEYAEYIIASQAEMKQGAKVQP